MGANELFAQGDLEGAIEAVTDEVRAHPTESHRRTFLFELLCFAGALDRAARQLDVIAHQDAMAEPAVQVYRNVLTAEQTRRRVYEESLRPEFLLDPPPFAPLHLQAIGRLREGRGAEARALLDQSDAMRLPLQGRIDGRPFDEFRDCDDLVAPFLELIVVTHYIWLPLMQVRELEFAVPERPRDLIWAPARLVLTDGTQHRGYVPALYWDSYRHPNDQVKLGRMTDWVAADGDPVRGVGQRMFLAGEDGHPLLETRRIEFDPAAPTAA